VSGEQREFHYGTVRPGLAEAGNILLSTDETALASSNPLIWSG
jgi:hypothetical protein